MSSIPVLAGYLGQHRHCHSVDVGATLLVVPCAVHFRAGRVALCRPVQSLQETSCAQKQVADTPAAVIHKDTPAKTPTGASQGEAPEACDSDATDEEAAWQQDASRSRVAYNLLCDEHQRKSTNDEGDAFGIAPGLPDGDLQDGDVWQQHYDINSNGSSPGAAASPVKFASSAADFGEDGAQRGGHAVLDQLDSPACAGPSNASHAAVDVDALQGAASGNADREAPPAVAATDPAQQLRTSTDADAAGPLASDLEQRGEFSAVQGIAGAAKVPQMAIMSSAAGQGRAPAPSGKAQPSVRERVKRQPATANSAAAAAAASRQQPTAEANAARMAGAAQLPAKVSTAAKRMTSVAPEVQQACASAAAPNARCTLSNAAAMAPQAAIAASLAQQPRAIQGAADAHQVVPPGSGSSAAQRARRVAPLVQPAFAPAAAADMQAALGNGGATARQAPAMAAAGAEHAPCDGSAAAKQAGGAAERARPSPAPSSAAVARAAPRSALPARAALCQIDGNVQQQRFALAPAEEDDETTKLEAAASGTSTRTRRHKQLADQDTDASTSSVKAAGSGRSLCAPLLFKHHTMLHSVQPWLSWQACCGKHAAASALCRF